MKRSQLPLTGLRTFEAAGRLLSFTRAAEELHVSQAAVSRQVRQLEERLGVALFERQHRAVVLTPAGQSLLETVTQAFDSMDLVLARLSQQPRDGGRVRINAEPSFAGCWLVPNLPAFRALHPEIDVIIETDHRLVSFRGNSPDLAIRYSLARDAWPEAEARLLYEATVLPVTAPDLLHRAQGRWMDLPRLHEQSRDLWAWWLAEHGLTGAENRGPILADGFQVLQAAIGGQGVALVDGLQAEDALRRGLLAVLPEVDALVQGRYSLVCRQFSRLSPAARRFADWVMAAVG